ncbi:GRAS family protein RAM1-like [Primulina huaijiensis]|uniref:GRAS family protein RAM1-like n=1 Tax=Primulina huaijiensis TaxID=1492673 RepID=UPI003CC79495
MVPHSSEEEPLEDKRPRTVSYLVEAKEECPHVLWKPFDILNKYGSKTKRLRSGETFEPNKQETESTASSGKQLDLSLEMKGGASNGKLTATTIMRMAGMKSNAATMGDQELESGLTQETSKHLLLAMCLLDAADKFSCQQYDLAENLLINVLKVSDPAHNHVQRVVTCFARNLLEKIETETGKIDLEREVGDLNLEEAILDLKVSMRKVEQKLPLCQITHFTGVQTILDSVASAKRIHFIDIGVKIGSHWIVLMDALANRKNCPIEQLKISAVATSIDKLDETGKVLSSFAKSMNLSFTFRILNSEIHELRSEMFELEAGEAVAVYMEFCLQSLSDSPKKLESLVREVKNLNPCVTVVSDIEADIRGWTFIGRFYESLLLCSAMFDCLEDCLSGDSDCRKIIEKLYFQEIIKPMMLAVDDNNLKHHLKIDFWRGYFARFDVVEMELSQSSMFQASLLLKESDSRRACTLSMNGKSMLLGWKGTSLRSVSAWKF